MSGNLSSKSGDKKTASKPVGLQNSGLASLLSGLKADEYQKVFNEDDSHEEDEDADKLIERRISMNQDNKAGVDFESHLIQGHN